MSVFNFFVPLEKSFNDILHDIFPDMGCESNWIVNFFWATSYPREFWSCISWDAVVSELPEDGTLRLACDDARCFYEVNRFFTRHEFENRDRVVDLQHRRIELWIDFPRTTHEQLVSEVESLKLKVEELERRLQSLAGSG